MTRGPGRGWGAGRPEMEMEGPGVGKEVKGRRSSCACTSCSCFLSLSLRHQVSQAARPSPPHRSARERARSHFNKSRVFPPSRQPVIIYPRSQTQPDPRA